MKNIEITILEYLANNPLCSSKEVYERISSNKGYATIKRVLSKLIENNFIVSEGSGKGTKYKLSPSFTIIKPIDLEEYFKEEQDQRKILPSFNFHLIGEILPKVLYY